MSEIGATSSTGHPRGLKILFFAEMWERLGFYLMLGILFLYMIDNERGGLGFTTAAAGEIYGTYMAFVYFTPFIGGMIADRLLGYRRSVLLGGLLFTAGYFALAVRAIPTFYGGLVLLCLGNGFFKPNISAMVGNLYAADDPRRDAGFNIFYMGINIGAMVSALLAAPLRNLWSFNMAFGAAGVGMLVGVVILVANWRALADADHQSVAEPDELGLGGVLLRILGPALVFGVGGYFVGQRIAFIANTIGPVTFGFIVGMVPIMVYFAQLVRRADSAEKPGLAALIPVYIAGGAFFMVLHLSGGLITVFAEHNTERRAEWVPAAAGFYAQSAMPSYYRNASPEVPRPDERGLYAVSDTMEAMFGARVLAESALAEIRADHKSGVTIGTVADLPPPAGAFTCLIYPDANVVVTTRRDTHGVHAMSVNVVPKNAKATGEVTLVRLVEGHPVAVIPVGTAAFDALYKGTVAHATRLPIGVPVKLLNAELLTGFLSPFFVVICTPLVMWYFRWRERRGHPVSTARKIFTGMVITAVSLLLMALCAWVGHDGAVKTSMVWLIFYYLIITFGELCLSPMGLSLVTKLAPKRLVGLMMGGWFLSTAIGSKLSGFISGLEPSATMFLVLAAAIGGVAAFLWVLLPRLDAAIAKYGA